MAQSFEIFQQCNLHLFCLISLYLFFEPTHFIFQLFSMWRHPLFHQAQLPSFFFLFFPLLPLWSLEYQSFCLSDYGCIITNVTLSKLIGVVFMVPCTLISQAISFSLFTILSVGNISQLSCLFFWVDGWIGEAPLFVHCAQLSLFPSLRSSVAFAFY